MFKSVSLLFLAGLGQLTVALASLVIPKILNWRSELRRLEPLTRQVFWTYATYILATNLFFALISMLEPGALVDHTPLAAALTTFMALYWAGRLAVQFFFFHESGARRTFSFRLAEALLVSGFIFFTVVYTGAAWVNLR